jgi:hypothetical protein
MARKPLMHRYIIFETLEVGPDCYGQTLKSMRYGGSSDEDRFYEDQQQRPARPIPVATTQVTDLLTACRYHCEAACRPNGPPVVSAAAFSA